MVASMRSVFNSRTIWNLEDEMIGPFGEAAIIFLFGVLLGIGGTIIWLGGN